MSRLLLRTVNFGREHCSVHVDFKKLRMNEQRVVCDFVCFAVSLFHVLALNAKVCIAQPYTPLWSQLTGLALPDDQAMTITQLEQEVPLLLKDVTALLIQFMVELPLNVDRAYFSTVVQMLYNLNVVQAFAQITCLLSDLERQKYKSLYMVNAGRRHETPDTLLQRVNTFVGYLVDIFEHSSLYMHADDDENQSGVSSWSDQSVVEASTQLCLPFMRAAAVLQSHLFSEQVVELQSLGNISLFSLSLS